MEIFCHSFTPQRKDVKLVIHGKSREEDIKFYIDENEVIDDSIFSMNKPAHDHIINHIKQLRHHQEYDSNITITEPINLHDNFLINKLSLPSSFVVGENSFVPNLLMQHDCINNNSAKNAVLGILDFQEKLLSSLAMMKKRHHAYFKIILPILSNKSHWYVAAISIEANHAVIQIVNSTNEMGKKPFSEIKADYDEKLIRFVAKILTASGFTISSDFKFIQSLQYGNMGCGIAVIKNIDKLILNEFLERDIFNENDHYEDGLPKDGDKSLRSTIYEEALGRAWLYLQTS